MLRQLDEWLVAPPDHAPSNRIALVRSVWHGLRGDWTQAHAIAQEQSGADAAWVHAWLHRIEGDAANANYWYRRARRDPYTGDTTAQDEAVAAALLAR